MAYGTTARILILAAAALLAGCWASPVRAESATTAEDESWRVRLGRYHGNGWLMPPGFRESLETDVPAGSVLRFVSVTAPTAPPGHSGADPELELRVLLNGAEIHRHRQSVENVELARHHEVPLPPQGGRGGHPDVRGLPPIRGQR